MHSDTREFIGFIGMCCSGIEAGFQQGVLQQDCSRIRLIFIGITGMCCCRIGAGLQQGSLERDSSDVLFIYIACENVLSMGRQGRHGERAVRERALDKATNSPAADAVL